MVSHEIGQQTGTLNWGLPPLRRIKASDMSFLHKIQVFIKISNVHVWNPRPDETRFVYM